MQTDDSPGLALRLTTLAAAASTLLTVISGDPRCRSRPSRAGGARAATPRRRSLTAAFVHRRLATAGLERPRLFLAAAPVPGRPFHIAFAALAFAACAWLAAASWRGEPVAAGARATTTLTKPRIMTLLLLTGACGMFVGDKGVPPAGSLLVMLLGLALACGGASALNHVLDRDIDRLMGAAPPTGRSRRDG